jgi:Flp pilus assembly protein TadD
VFRIFSLLAPQEKSTILSLVQTSPLQKRLEEGRELLRQSSFSEAVAAFEKLTRAHPHMAQVWFDYGCAALSAGQIDLADRAWHRARELEPASLELPLQMGHQYQNHRHLEKARAAFEQACALRPNAINPRMALVILFERNHQFAEAREAIEACLKLDPNDDQARYFLAFLDRRENKLDDAERRLRDLIASGPKHQFVQYASRYELAEILDRTERYEEALKTLVEAKRLIRGIVNVDALWTEYDVTAVHFKRYTSSLPKDIIRTWSKEFPERAREPIPRLAFLGGHPRSGTTLLEQILGAHPEVASLDESLAFDNAVARPYNALKQWPPARLNVMRRRYIQAFRSELGSSDNGQLLLDKNPSPTVRLRIWLRVFPELRVIIALRDPRDIIISCFFQNIPINAINANFLSLSRAVKHYANLMDVWLAVREWEGFSWIETRYEDTVNNLGSEGRRVTEFLGLDWHEDQARFYEKNDKKRIFSPTYHDASQPVYKRSVARWTAYEKYLAPLLPELARYCQAFGYET